MSIALPGKKIQALVIIIVGIFLAYFISTFNVSSWFGFMNPSSEKAVSSLEAASLSDVD